jgi:hypothetical protein
VTDHSACTVHIQAKDWLFHEPLHAFSPLFLYISIFNYLQTPYFKTYTYLHAQYKVHKLHNRSKTGTSHVNSFLSYAFTFEGH